MAEQPDVVFTAFDDMMRVPATQGSPPEYQSRREHVRHRLFPGRRIAARAQESRPRAYHTIREML